MSDDSHGRARDFDLDFRRDRTTASLIAADVALAAPGAHGAAAWLAHQFNENFNAYDRAIDGAYTTIRVGGSRLHHLLDQQHTILGAFQAVRGVSVDDSWVTEVCRAGEHLLRDTMSVSGINPFFSLSPETYRAVADAAQSVGVSRAYLADALTMNGPELFGGTIALVGALITAKDPDPSRLSQLGGAYLVSAAVSANPLLIPIAAGSLAYALYNCEDKTEVFVNAGKGALVSGSALLISSLVGGPLWMGCLAGALTAIAVKQCMDHPQKAWQRAQAAVHPARQVFASAARQIGAMRYEPA
jgi:hypothetical protein